MPFSGFWNWIKWNTEERGGPQIQVLAKWNTTKPEAVLFTANFTHGKFIVIFLQNYIVISFSEITFTRNPTHFIFTFVIVLKYKCIHRLSTVLIHFVWSSVICTHLRCSYWTAFPISCLFCKHCGQYWSITFFGTQRCLVARLVHM